MICTLTIKYMLLLILLFTYHRLQRVIKALGIEMKRACTKLKWSPCNKAEPIITVVEKDVTEELSPYTELFTTVVPEKGRLL